MQGNENDGRSIVLEVTITRGENGLVAECIGGGSLGETLGAAICLREIAEMLEERAEAPSLHTSS